MQKILISVAVVSIIQLMSMFYYQAKVLDEPIVIASEVDEQRGGISVMNIAYITNRLTPIDLRVVEVNQHSFAVQDNQSFLQGNTMFMETQALNNYTYYSIYTATIHLMDDEYDNAAIAQATEATLYFNDGSKQQVPLTVHQFSDVQQLQLHSSSAGSGTTNMYSLTEPLTLHTVKVVDDKVKIVEMTVNHEPIALPLTEPLQLEEHDVISITTTDGIARYLGEYFTIELGVVDKQEQQLVLPIMNNVNDRPSNEWVQAVVKERAQ